MHNNSRHIKAPCPSAMIPLVVQPFQISLDLSHRATRPRRATSQNRATSSVLISAARPCAQDIAQVRSGWLDGLTEYNGIKTENGFVIATEVTSCPDRALLCSPSTPVSSANLAPGFSLIFSRYVSSFVIATEVTSCPQRERGRDLLPPRF
jgi:hypothetical protein